MLYLSDTHEIFYGNANIKQSEYEAYFENYDNHNNKLIFLLTSNIEPWFANIIFNSIWIYDNIA